MGTGTAVAEGDKVTHTKMNLKQEDFRDIPAFGILDQSGAGAQELLIAVSENLTADTTLTITVNDANRTIDIAGNITLAAALTTVTAAITLTANAAGSSVTLPASGTLATLTGSENLTNKTLTAAALSGTFTGTPTFSGATITLTGGTLNLTAGAAYVIGTTDNFALTIKTNAVNKLGFTVTLGSFTVYQATANYTLAFTDPAAARAITFPDPGGNDSVCYLAATQNLTNKTLAGVTISGNIVGTPTITGATYSITAGGAFVFGTTDNNTITVKTNAVNKFAFTVTLGQFTVFQTTANYTLAFSDPAAGRTITFADPLGADSVAYLAATQSLTNKTIGAATLAGTLTRAGDQTIDLTGAATRTLTVTNSTAGQVANLDVDGVLILRNNTAFTATLTCTPTANRTITFQDVTGNVYISGGTDVAVADGGTGLSAWTATSLCYASAAGVLGSLGAATDGQIPIGSTGAAPVLAAITGTANQVVVTNAAGSITLSTPQSIAVASTPTFAGLTLSGDLTFNAALDIELAANTAAALEINSTGVLTVYAIDTRTATDNVIVHTFDAPDPTFASAAGTTYNLVRHNAYTVNLTGNTGVTAMNGLSLNLQAVTLAAAGATTVGIASTLYLTPVTAGANITITTSYMINTSVAGCFLTAAGVWTDASSLEHKTDISPLDIKRIPKLLDSLNVVNYRRKDTSDGGSQRFGLIAEEAPDFIAAADHRGIAAIDMAGFALAALKWLSAEHDKLKKKVASLESKLQAQPA